MADFAFVGPFLHGADSEQNSSYETRYKPLLTRPAEKSPSPYPVTRPPSQQQQQQRAQPEVQRNPATSIIPADPRLTQTKASPVVPVRQTLPQTQPQTQSQSQPGQPSPSDPRRRIAKEQPTPTSTGTTLRPPPQVITNPANPPSKYPKPKPPPLASSSQSQSPRVESTPRPAPTPAAVVPKTESLAPAPISSPPAPPAASQVRKDVRGFVKPEFTTTPRSSPTTCLKMEQTRSSGSVPGLVTTQGTEVTREMWIERTRSASHFVNETLDET